MKLLKIAVKAVRSSRYRTFKLCSSCPYKKEFYDTEIVVTDNLNDCNIMPADKVDKVEDSCFVFDIK